MAEFQESHGSDFQSLRIGDWEDVTGDRIPGLVVELRRSGGYLDPSSPLRTLADLSFTNAGLVIALEGLAADDLRDLAQFLLEYQVRLGDPWRGPEPEEDLGD